MNILQVVYAFYPPYSESGNSRVVYEISKGLAARGHNVTVYTTNVLSQDKMFSSKKEIHNVHGVKVYFCRNLLYKPHSPLPLFYSRDLVRKIQKNLAKYDVVHLHHYRFYISVILHHYAVKCDVPYILQAHGSIPRKGKQGLKCLYDVLFGYRLLRDASKVIALSEVEAEQYRSMSVPEEKIAIIPNGIDLSEYAELPPKGSFKKKFNVPEDKKIVLYLGRIHKIKGIDFLVRAYAYLVNKMHFEDAVLVIAGPDDGYLKEVKELTATLRISKNVFFTGLLSEKDKIAAYVDANIVVNVEPINVYGLVPLEAAACETPVIVSKGNAIKNIMHEGKFGFSVKYGDIYELARILRKVIVDDDLLKRMGQNGRKFVFANLGWTKQVEKLEKVYEEVVEG